MGVLHPVSRPDDGARLKKTPETVRSDARSDALVLAKGALEDLLLSQRWLSIDRPELAEGYDKLMIEAEQYVEHLSQLVDKSQVGRDG